MLYWISLMLLVGVRLMVLMFMMSVLTFMTMMMLLMMILMMILTMILMMILMMILSTIDDTDDGGRGNRRPRPGGAEFISKMMIYDETLILDLVLSRNRLK